MQLTWRAAPAAGLQIEVGDQTAKPLATPKAELVLGPRDPLENGGRVGRFARRYWDGRRVLDPGFPSGPGSVLVEGLRPGTTYDVLAQAEGVAQFVAARFRTLRPPPGRLLSKFATVSDMHIGERRFGILERIQDQRQPSEVTQPYPNRALQAAIDEAVAWGAQLLVAKGDLVHMATPAEARDVGRLLAASPVPVEALLGNHDNNTGVNLRALLEREGIIVPWRPRALELDGARLVLASTAHGGARYHRGQFTPALARQVARLAAEAAGPVWVGLHHPPERHHWPTVYPPGLPFEEGRGLFAQLARAKPDAFVSCGHRHRNRRYYYQGLTVTEVGSTKDYPGVWAGYKVFEGGVLQVLRRTARPDVLSWTETTRRALNGQWARWSPGRLSDRCLVHSWE